MAHFSFSFSFFLDSGKNSEKSLIREYYAPQGSTAVLYTYVQYIGNVCMHTTLQSTCTECHTYRAHPICQLISQSIHRWIHSVPSSIILHKYPLMILAGRSPPVHSPIRSHRPVTLRSEFCSCPLSYMIISIIQSKPQIEVIYNFIISQEYSS